MLHLLLRPGVVSRLAASQVNGRHRILVIPSWAAWAGTTRGLVNVELPVSGNAASRRGTGRLRGDVRLTV